MSCEYCKGMLIAGAEGHFMIGKRTLHSRNGDTVIQPIMRYEASDWVFSSEIEVDDHIVIKFCPMCGDSLNDGGEA